MRVVPRLRQPRWYGENTFSLCCAFGSPCEVVAACTVKHREPCPLRDASKHDRCVERRPRPGAGEKPLVASFLQRRHD
eukprot:1023909-Pyramimonas_sp.AAC.1